VKRSILILSLLASLTSSLAMADGLNISRPDVTCALKSLTDSTSETLFIPRPNLKVGPGMGETDFQGLVFESKNLPGGRLGITVSSNEGAMMHLEFAPTTKSSVTVYESSSAVVELTCTPVKN
jgi:hypothetical protein